MSKPTIGQVAKSKTQWAAGAVIALGFVVQNLEALTPYFGQYGGLAGVLLGALFAGLRFVTDEPLNRK